MTRLAATHTLRKLRRLYQETWKLPWPHDDNYLTELWKESNPKALRGRAAKACFEETLIVMREEEDRK